jgi:alpha-beta hydrolase superfamily lysophospholipase
MRPVGEALAEAGWRAEAILLPGFGPDIPNLGQYGQKAWLTATETAWAVQCEGDLPRVLCGYSMGGTLALIQALAQPPDLLILISPFTRLPGWLPPLVSVARHFIKGFQPFRRVKFSDPRVQEQFANFLPGVDLEDPEVQEKIRAEFILPLQPIHEILEMGKQGFQRAGEITSPTLIIQGADDPIVRPSATRQFAKRMDPALLTYHEVAGGHDLLAEGSNQTTGIIDLIIEHVKVLQ